MADDIEHEGKESKSMEKSGKEYEEPIESRESSDEGHTEERTFVEPTATSSGGSEDGDYTTEETIEATPTDDKEQPGEGVDDPFGSAGEDDLFFKPDNPIQIEEDAESQNSSPEENTENAETNVDLEKAEGLNLL